jgi:hypothetical protein
MKKQLFILFTFLTLIFSCKKEPLLPVNNNTLTASIKTFLKANLSAKDFASLDFNKNAICNYKGFVSIYTVPFVSNTDDLNFVAVKIINATKIDRSMIVEINGNEPTNKSNTMYNGNISIQSLNRNIILKSAIVDGYVSAWHQPEKAALQKADVVEVPIVDLPEVVVSATRPSGGSGISFFTWYNIMDMFAGGSSGGSSMYQGVNNSTGSESGSVAGAAGVGGGNNQGPIQIDFETSNENPAIDISKFLKCFGNVPDAGSICSIRILTDIPVDSNPNIFFDYSTGSPGHTFIQLTKTTESISVKQNIGFYPVSGWKTFATPAPVDGKFVDNAGHEFNASLLMTLTPQDLQGVLIHIAYLARFIKYDIDDYNCTDFALDVFNYKRGGNQLAIPKYNLPGSQAPNGTNTPQGLYQKLAEMKKQGGTEANKIVIPGVKGFVGNSNGPCN